MTDTLHPVFRDDIPIPIHARQAGVTGLRAPEGMSKRDTIAKLCASPVGTSIWLEMIPRDAKGSLVSPRRLPPGVVIAMDREHGGYRFWRAA